MAVRTTAILVGGLLELDAEIDITPFIDTANMLVNRVVATAVDADDVAYYTDPELELIERWLAAHFYCVRDKRSQFEGAGSVMVKYESRVELHLDNTSYGQQAMLLDVAGGLANLNQDMKKGKRGAASLFWGGTEGKH